MPLCVALYDAVGRAWILGPVATAPVLGPIPAGQAARLLQAALVEPSGTAARARVLQARDAIETADIPGFDSQGLFAIRELTWGVPRRSDWTAACERARALMATTPRGTDLVRGLGFESHTVAGNALLLTVGDETPRAVAILLRDDESFDAESTRFAKSPIYHGLEIARRNNVRVARCRSRASARVYPTSPDVGVGRRGATQTYFGLDLALLDDEHAGHLELAFSGRAPPDDTFRRTPLTDLLSERLHALHDGRAELPAVAYLVLSAIETSFGGRKKSAATLFVDPRVLGNLGRLSSQF
ncbi:MAG: hypothetical protein WKF78_06370 [Candidatus Limnocylindrales bacterium]